MMNELEYKAREWLHKKHPDIRCWACARCKGIGELSCCCRDDYGNYMLVPYSHGIQSCDFVRTVEEAAREAHDRLAYMGYESLPPMVKDVFNILDESLAHARKQRSKFPRGHIKEVRDGK